MLSIDGSMGEGGGQVLRTSLALSAVQRTPFCIRRIRANRKRPGLLRQHLTAVRAVAEVCQARVRGDDLGSSELTFEPGDIQHGNYHFKVGSAGSAMLVFQSVLPPLLVKEGRSRLVLEGGTHNPMAPSFDFVEQTFLPLLHQMGASVHIELLRAGFYPAGGGRFTVDVVGGAPLRPLALLQRGELQAVRVRVLISGVPEHVAEREMSTVSNSFAELPLRCEVVRVEAAGPGNVVSVNVCSARVTETFTGFGERGVRAESIARRVAGEVRKYLAAGVPVGEYLADQLLVPLALGGGGSFCSVEPSLHTQTNCDVVGLFLPRNIAWDPRRSTLSVR